MNIKELINDETVQRTIGMDLGRLSVSVGEILYKKDIRGRAFETLDENKRLKAQLRMIKNGMVAPEEIEL